MTYKCRHIKSSGEKCGAIAMIGKPWCYFHGRLHQITSPSSRPSTERLRLPVLENQTDVQLAVAQILDAVCASRLDARRAGLCLYGIQIAARTVQVRAFPIPDHPVEEVTQSDAGEDLAPEERQCKVPDNCAACVDKETCKVNRPVPAEPAKDQCALP
jgi:hypothetical protein